MSTRIQRANKDFINITLDLVQKAMPARAKVVEPDLLRIAKIGADAIGKFATIEEDVNLTPAGKRDAKKKVFADVVPVIKEYRAKVAKGREGIEAARRAAVSVPPEKPGASLLSDEVMFTQLGKMSSDIIQQRYAQGLAGDARWHQVVRVVQKARAAGVPILPDYIQDLYDSAAFEASEARDRVEADEQITGYLAGLTGTVTAALREVADDDGLGPELAVALEEVK